MNEEFKHRLVQQTLDLTFKKSPLLFGVSHIDIAVHEVTTRKYF